MFSFISNAIAEHKRTQRVERILDKRLTDHGLLARVEVADAQTRIMQAESRLVEQAEPALKRLRNLRKTWAESPWAR